MITTQQAQAGAVAFAAFAAWFALKGSKPTQSATSDANKVFGAARSQREAVGAALQQNVQFAEDFTSQYAKRQGVNNAGSVDVLGHTADYYAFQPSYALG
jgi:hypothetical protein